MDCACCKYILFYCYLSLSLSLYPLISLYKLKNFADIAVVIFFLPRSKTQAIAEIHSIAQPYHADTAANLVLYMCFLYYAD